MSNPFDRNRVREPKLGEIITGNGPEIRRDAVHIAVIPMIAGEDLSRGQRVAITHEDPPVAIGNDKSMPGTYDDGALYRDDPSGSIGIVDPFLTKSYIRKGERFWLFVYPGQVTTLSHVWTHPAFADEGAPTASKCTERQESERWLRNYAIRYFRYSTPEEGYQKLLQQMQDGTITYEGKDMHSRAELEDADDLKRHAEIVLGRVINYDDFHYFSCTC